MPHRRAIIEKMRQVCRRPSAPTVNHTVSSILEASALPIASSVAAVRTALAGAGRAVLAAAPGSGKTTLIPLALLDEPWLAGKKIVLLEPRRVAARAAASRMAALLGEAVGGTVGYQIRFERKVSARTRIEVVTEGLLSRRLQADPELPGVGLVIFDEFHERSLDADLALALSLDARTHLRPDLRILVMSATLDTERIARLLDHAPIVTGGGRPFPVDIHYVPAAAELEHGELVARGVIQALPQTAGDILAFLPGAREIRQAHYHLETRFGAQYAICPLMGELSSEAQDLALRADAQGRRKLILATNIAQTSLTVEGVTAVVDGGLVRVARFDFGAGSNRLETQRVSRASADQRAGRAGRLGPGVCFRLWSRDQQAMLAAHDTAEILSVDLTGFALDLATWGAAPETLALLDAPPATSWAYARDRLGELGALDEHGRVTAHGRALARLPVAPRRAHMLLTAQQRGDAEIAAWVAAALDERDPSRNSDLADRVLRYRRGLGEPATIRRVRDTAQQLLRIIGASSPHGDTDERAVADATAWAYPERIAQRRDLVRGAPEIAYLCADGGEARLKENDPLAQSQWLTIAHWEPGPPRRIRLAAPIDEPQLLSHHADRFSRETIVRWDRGSQAVIAEQQLRLGQIIVERRPIASHQHGSAISAAMVAGIREMGLDVLPWTENARQWQARVLSLRAWRPEEEWPEVSDEALEAGLENWLAPYLDGLSRREHLNRLDLAGLLNNLLDSQQQRSLQQLAPTHIEVPTGSRLRLEYRPPQSPALSVKLQEMFGCSNTPSINGGRTPVVLHLLSPAQRPIAVTSDLAGFWRGSYAEVRKDLRGRYPRHPWPEDPLQAAPTRRAKPRV